MLETIIATLATSAVSGIFAYRAGRTRGRIAGLFEGREICMKEFDVATAPTPKHQMPLTPQPKKKRRPYAHRGRPIATQRNNSQLARVRLRLGMTQGEIGKVIERSDGFISKVERGVCHLRHLEAEALLKFVNEKGGWNLTLVDLFPDIYKDGGK